MMSLDSDHFYYGLFDSMIVSILKTFPSNSVNIWAKRATNFDYSQSCLRYKMIFLAILTTYSTCGTLESLSGTLI